MGWQDSAISLRRTRRISKLKSPINPVRLDSIMQEMSEEIVSKSNWVPISFPSTAPRFLARQDCTSMQTGESNGGCGAATFSFRRHSEQREIYFRRRCTTRPRQNLARGATQRDG